MSFPSLYPNAYRVPLAILGLAALVAIAFPLGGAAIALIAVVDFLLPKRIKEAGSAKA